MVVKDMKRRKKANVVFIQETKLEAMDIIVVKSITGLTEDFAFRRSTAIQEVS